MRCAVVSLAPRASVVASLLPSTPLRRPRSTLPVPLPARVAEFEGVPLTLRCPSVARRVVTSGNAGFRDVAVGAVSAISAAYRVMASALGVGPSPAFVPGQEWWTKDTVAVVTGANKGIGFAIAKGLAEAGLKTVLTARDPKLGQAAVSELQGQGLQNLVYHQLDITDAASIQNFAKWVEESFGGLDILVNNAGMAYKGNVFGAKEAKHTIAVNYGGTRALSEALLPLLRPSPAGARIVNVCSQAGLLKIVSPDLQKRFTAPDLSAEKLDQLASEFVEGIVSGEYKAQGWPGSMYGVSKVLEAAYTRVLAKELEGRPEGSRVFVNACCPGYVATDMSSHMGPKSISEGADTPIFLALRSPSEAKTGAFFYERKERSF